MAAIIGRNGRTTRNPGSIEAIWKKWKVEAYASMPRQGVIGLRNQDGIISRDEVMLKTVTRTADQNPKARGMASGDFLAGICCVIL